MGCRSNGPRVGSKGLSWGVAPSALKKNKISERVESIGDGIDRVWVSARDGLDRGLDGGGHRVLGGRPRHRRRGGGGHTADPP